MTATEQLDRHFGWPAQPREALALSGFAGLTAMGFVLVLGSVRLLLFLVPLALGCVLALLGGFGGVRGWPPGRWLQLVGLGAVNIGAVAIATLAVGIWTGSLAVALYLSVPALVGAGVLARGVWLVAAARTARAESAA